MESLSISFAYMPCDKITLKHTNREFFAKNIYGEKTRDNIIYKQENLKKFYDDVFGEALKEYNERQKQPCRRIENYLEHIQNSEQENPFYDVVIQYGDKETAGVGSQKGEVAKQMLNEYMKAFEKRNPNLKVFNAIMHLDETCPHIHFSFVPVAKANKNGLPLKNSLTRALSQQGYTKGKGKADSEWSKWIEAEKTLWKKFCIITT